MATFTIRREPRQAQYFTEELSGAGLDMILIPAGTFLMGSPTDEEGQRDREEPQHQVTVPSFFMGRYPVTQAQYEAVTGINPATGYDRDRFVAPNKPVVGVSWEDAIAFCERLSQQTDRTYRLPSEAEWEYACRAGTQTPFYFGETITAEVANFNASNGYGSAPKGEYRQKTTPVNFFDAANDFGLCDMHGNVFEWCLDHWHKNYNDAPDDGSAWIEGGKSDTRVIRGGSWDIDPHFCRSAYRYGYSPDYRFYSFGFRVVCAFPRTD